MVYPVDRRSRRSPPEARGQSENQTNGAYEPALLSFLGLIYRIEWIDFVLLAHSTGRQAKQGVYSETLCHEILGDS